MPSGVFKPYAGVSTAIMIFTKTEHGGTDKVWFYDMKADGFSLDDKRSEIAENDMEEQLELFFEDLAEAKPSDVDYIKNKYLAVREKMPMIDIMIDEKSKGWKTSRMGKVELTILRLAVYEMKWDDEIPEGVAIDQAVELAKKYSGDDGPSFINGVLAKLA